MSKQTVCPVNTKCCVQQHTFHYISFERHIKSQNKRTVSSLQRFFLNRFILRDRSQILERDVKIYIDMISVTQQATAFDAHNY